LCDNDNPQKIAAVIGMVYLESWILGPSTFVRCWLCPRLPDAIIPDTIMPHRGDCTFSSTYSSRYVHTRRESTFHCHVISFQKLDWLKAMWL